MQSRLFFLSKLFVFLAFFSLQQVVQAVNQDFSILCQQKELCKQIGNDSAPIFSEENIVPGQSFTRTVKVTNDNKLHSCQLHLRLSESNQADENKLAEKLYVQVFRQNNLLLGAPIESGASLTIAQLQAETFARYFWSLPPKVSEVFDLKITFDPQADNQYQGTQVATDIAIAITCLQEAELPPNPELPFVLPKNTELTNETLLTGCTTSVSQTAPQLQVVRTDNERGLVGLSWQPVQGASEYWLEFGTSENSDQFRHKGITTTVYTLLDLDLQHDLFFRILPVADCARGSYSNTASIFGSQVEETVTGVATLSGQPQVLGSQERSAPPTRKSETGNTVQYQLPATFILAILFIWLLFRQRKKKSVISN
ncbi:MAG: hypothetical protein GW946_02270 [Candidatus Pacebacteria bacterium]|nr:hypothetical protein [Candidatus Paceibacterota bacterium]PIR60385.1 MAG: hypothetical protein COU67_02415 [Candidatus Pacebacteria bacterium CG10_big_fil_rev_8_21_14_0_10_44_54]